MDPYQTLIEKAKAGFASLDLPDNFTADRHMCDPRLPNPDKNLDCRQLAEAAAQVYTANLSGAFENVTFNIPNPEVIQSFDMALPNADAIGADVIMSTDPDSDRIGSMVRHNGEWTFLNGNEIEAYLSLK